MTDDVRREALVETDWGDRWESLPEAPPLVPRPKTTQITLRVPSSTISRLKTVATTKSLPYHALARSWILDALRSTVTPRSVPIRYGTKSAQLNLKVDQVLLDSLKRHASRLRRPYHALAREYIETALEREEKELGIDSSPHSLPAMK